MEEQDLAPNGQPWKRTKLPDQKVPKESNLMKSKQGNKNLGKWGIIASGSFVDSRDGIDDVDKSYWEDTGYDYSQVIGGRP